jgi:hypothetical protein
VTRPDPAIDLIGSIRWLMDRVEAIEHREDERKVSARAAALALGYPVGYCHGKPWRVPHYGKGGTRHPLSAWKEWLDAPEAERRAGWDAMSLADRRRVRGAA